MHVLFVHQNHPAQFGHIAEHLAKARGWRCTFVSQTPGGTAGGVEKIQYRIAGGATQQNHYCSRTFENNVWHCDAVYRALMERPDVQPDLIVGHSGFGSTLFLRELYPRVPVVNLFEFYYRPHDAQSDMGFRRDLGWVTSPMKFLRSYCRNSMILLDLQNCQVGYTPTGFQRSRFPAEYQYKLRTIFDGVDRTVFHSHGDQLRPPVGRRGPRTIAGVDVPADTRVVTYCSRGFESMRGFDIFMRSAKRIAQEFADVVFIVAGAEKMSYGGDSDFLPPGQSFKDWVLSRETFDLSKIHFVGNLPTDELARTLAATDLHIYLTVPFVLSWSMMDAMSCGAVVLGSATAPVMEMIRDGETGLLADFFNPDDFAEKAVKVLRDPAQYRPLGKAAEAMIAERYSLEAVMPRMLKMYEDAAGMIAAPAVAPPVPLSNEALPPGEVFTMARPKARSPFLG